jgi:hypothetical protein
VTRAWALAASLASFGLAACIQIGDSPADAGADSPGACGSQTCNTTTQICLYRECTEKERCKPNGGASCQAGTTPADCGGAPGCRYDYCAPTLQGCRDIPSSCGGDVTCACSSICGGVAACAKVDGRRATCAATQ